MHDVITFAVLNVSVLLAFWTALRAASLVAERGRAESEPGAVTDPGREAIQAAAAPAWAEPQEALPAAPAPIAEAPTPGPVRSGPRHRRPTGAPPVRPYRCQCGPAAVIPLATDKEISQ
jgi:hypothetical protein